MKYVVYKSLNLYKLTLILEAIQGCVSLKTNIRKRTYHEWWSAYIVLLLLLKLYYLCFVIKQKKITTYL